MEITEFGDTHNPPAIFLHGYGAHPHLYREFIARLSEKYHVFVPHLFGLNNACRRSFAGNVEAMRDFLEKAQLTSSFVVGHSYGALVAMHLATYYPKLLRAVAVNPLLPNIFHGEKLRRQFENIQKDLQHATGGIRGILTHPEVGIRYGMNILSNPLGYIDGATNAIVSALPEAQSEVPVDLVYADLDALFHIDNADVERWRQALPQLQFNPIPDYSHNWIIYYGSYAYDRLQNLFPTESA
ncbi:MAG TPA: alpha/beta fold hydrolase [Turneriella sp.]|nr:alpha/beta fold hydrolase [Turneriella sp.]